MTCSVLAMTALVLITLIQTLSNLLLIIAFILILLRVIDKPIQIVICNLRPRSIGRSACFKLCVLLLSAVEVVWPSTAHHFNLLAVVSVLSRILL